MREHISYSELMLFRKNCQWRWKLDFVDGHRAEVYGVHLDFGTAIHGAVEKYRTRKDPTSVEEAQKIFEEGFLKLWASNSGKYAENDRTSWGKLSPEQTCLNFIASGNNILQKFHECEELAAAEVVFNEHELLLPIDRTDDVIIKFKGFIDMVIKTKDKRGNSILYIVDFKSCSWGWDREKREDRDLHYQLFLYKHFLCKKFDLNPKEVRCAFVLLKKRPAKGVVPVEFFPVSAGPVSVQRSLTVLNETITDMDERMKTGIFIKNRNSCINDFKQQCPHMNTERCTS